MTDDTLRAAFEAHFRTRQGWCEEDLERGGRGHYAWRETQTAWDAYRAGYERAIAERARLGWMAPAWSPINTMDALCDDLVWLALIDNDGVVSIDGPRVANTDDYDTFSVWAPCEAPPNAHSGLAQEAIAEMVEAARIRALAKGAK